MEEGEEKRRRDSGGKETVGGEVRIKHAHERFFKRVLELTASHIFELANELNINDESIKEKIWETMKYCLSSESQLLMGRHIDQLILCSIYAVCKMAHSRHQLPPLEECTFNRIISAYMQLQGQAAHLVTTLFHSVKLDDKDSVNIIDFYNRVYLPKMKEAIIRICKVPNPLSQVSAPLTLTPNPTPIPIPTPNPTLASASAPSLPPERRAILRLLSPAKPLADILPPTSKYALPCRSNLPYLSPARRASPMPTLQSSGVIMTPRTEILFAPAEAQPHQPHSQLLAPYQGFRPKDKSNYKGSLLEKILDKQAPRIAVAKKC